jgi:hypothetical protein
MDCLAECKDKNHFRQYPDPVVYQYNSRGFRDAEWPDDLKNSIWCVGDSFTVGLGTPFEYIWPQVLQKKTRKRTINLSMDGASNNWMARRAADVLTIVQPSTMIFMWSYVERREDDFNLVLQQKWESFYLQVRDPSWPSVNRIEDFAQLPYEIRQELRTQHVCGPYLAISEDLSSIAPQHNIDELLRMQLPDATDSDHERNFTECLKILSDANVCTKLIHTFIPDFATVNQHQYLAQLNTNAVIPPFPILDWARDHHHFDRKTSDWLVTQLMPLLD